MARYDDRHGIRSASPRDGSHSFRIPDRLRDLRVRLCRARRDSLQLLPDAPLKCGRLHIKRQLDAGRFAFDTLNDLAEGLGIDESTADALIQSVEKDLAQAREGEGAA